MRAQLTDTRADVAFARTDSDAARVLASGADREVTEVRAELRAHTQALNALRETQLEQQSEMRDGFAKLNTGVATITVLLERIAEDGRE